MRLMSVREEHPRARPKWGGNSRSWLGLLRILSNAGVPEGILRIVIPNDSRRHRPDPWLELRRQALEGPAIVLEGGDTHQLQDALAQLDRFAALKENWDGHGAKPVAPAVLKKVLRHLETFAQAASLVGRSLPGPWLAMSADGSIGVDWRLQDRMLAVTFDATGEVEFFAQSPSTELGGGAVAQNALPLAGWLLKGTPLVVLGHE